MSFSNFTGVIIEQNSQRSALNNANRVESIFKKIGINNYVHVSSKNIFNKFYIHFESSAFFKDYCVDYDTSLIVKLLNIEVSYLAAHMVKETFLSMVLSPQCQDFESTKDFLNHLRMRCFLVDISARAKLDFNTKAINRPEKYWIYLEDHGFLLKNDVSLEEALEQTLCPDQSGKAYAFSCHRATEYLMLYGITRVLRRNKAALKILETQWQKSALMSDDFLETLLEEKGSRESPLPKRFYIPGDRVWFKNPDDYSSYAEGFEGSWVIYIGNGRFCNLWDHHIPFTFEQKCLEVYYWSKYVEFNEDGSKTINCDNTKKSIEVALNDRAIAEPILKKMLAFRDPPGVYGDGGCIDLTRDTYTTINRMLNNLRKLT